MPEYTKRKMTGKTKVKKSATLVRITSLIDMRAIRIGAMVILDFGFQILDSGPHVR
jgi:hypothetical protein